MMFPHEAWVVALLGQNTETGSVAYMYTTQLSICKHGGYISDSKPSKMHDTAKMIRFEVLIQLTFICLAFDIHI